MAEGRRDYSGEEVEAAREVLKELTDILHEYLSGIVIIGGSVPFFQIPQGEAPHEGTKDIDLALNPRRMPDTGYNTIEEILQINLYQQDEKKAFRYHRTVRIHDRPISVVIDFLTGEGAGAYRNGQIQYIQDVPASTLHGCDVAFLDFEEKEFAGATIRVASIPSFLVMKSFALHNRSGEDGRKDAYDIYYCIKHYPGGLGRLADRFQPLLDHEIVQDGLSKLAAKFASLEDTGPKFLAERAEDEEERSILQRDAYEQVNALLQRLGEHRC